MRTIKKFTLFTLLFSCSIFGNNLSVENVELVDQNVAGQYTFVQFDVSWENSWRTSAADPYNYDAIWVFVKYSVEGEAEWKHASLSTTPSDHLVNITNSVAAEFKVGETNSVGKGVFIQRSGDGTTGPINWDEVELKWLYGVDGVLDGENVTVKVFAIEMVYIPTESFYVGDGTDTIIAGHLHRADDTSVPFLISSENGFILGFDDPANLGNNNTVGQYPGSLDDFNSITAHMLSAAYPKGYNAFYMMKYEVTQGQYADFLNCLTRTQQDNRTTTDLSIIPVPAEDRYVMQNPPFPRGRSSIKCDADIPASGPVIFYCDLNDDETPGDGKDIACNYVHWLDETAYADWAGLRPFTELEFEKACRGTQTPTVNEYGWGNTILHSSSYEPIINPGAPNEVPSTSGTNGNSAYTGTVPFRFGPLRAGIFATNSSTRIIAGASYYGVMELTGNLWEGTVSLGRARGRLFEGTHGDGNLYDNGNHNISDWPGYVDPPGGSGGLIGVDGIGYRGGGIGGDLPWPPEDLRISARRFSNVNPNRRALEDGMRLVRTAP